MRSPLPPSSRFSWRRHGTRGLWIVGAAALLSVAWPLPESVRTESAVRSVRVTDRNGVLLRELRPDGRGTPVALSDVSPHAIDALVAIEDRHFYRHPGVNPLAVLRAARDNIRAGRVVSGGSTITMQVARALRGSESRTLPGKLAEAHLALRLEVRLSKEEILEQWLNRGYFGNQAYGIEAAARTYFGKGARDLTPAEAAYLVGLPQNPTGFDPYRFPEAAQGRQRQVLDALSATGAMPPEEAGRLADLPLPDLIPTPPPFQAPHFIELVRRELGPVADELTHVRTTLDARLQQEIEALARTHLARLNSENVGNAAVIVLDNDTGEVLAYLGSVDFWDAAAGGQNDGVLALRQPGSALKPFTYALALESGRYTPATVLADLEVQIPEAGGAFAPQNYDKTFHGPIPFRDALANSYNVPAVRLARELGPERLLDRLHAFGFASLSRPAEHYGVGLTLGNGEVRLIELARAYATFARGGAAPTIRAVVSATTSDGSALSPEAISPATPAAVSPDIAFLIADILSDPEARQAAFGRYGPLELPFPAAVKTGTTKDYRDNWAVGFTPAHTVAVWVGNFDGSPMQRVSGVSGAGPLFKSIMQRLGPGGAFATPAGVAEALVCPASGNQPGAFCPVRQRVWMGAGALPADTCTVHREVVIDRRNGLLADASTPAARRQPTRYTVYPPEFHGWMRDRGLPLPPTVTLAQAGPDEAPTYDAGLRVAYPVSGARFQIDPVLRRSFQRIPLEAVVDETLAGPVWWIDGAPADLPMEDAFWTLAPGSHTFELRARTLAGAPVRSQPAHILVIDPLLEPPSLADPRELRVKDKIANSHTQSHPEPVEGPPGRSRGPSTGSG